MEKETLEHKLDAALIRPGRIDYQVQFQEADRGQVEALFSNFYQPREHEAPGMSGSLDLLGLEGAESSEQIQQRLAAQARRGLELLHGVGLVRARDRRREQRGAGADHRPPPRHGPQR